MRNLPVVRFWAFACPVDAEREESILGRNDEPDSNWYPGDLGGWEHLLSQGSKDQLLGSGSKSMMTQIKKSCSVDKVPLQLRQR